MSRGITPLALGAFLVLAACNLTGPDTQQFTIRVDSVSAPGAISAGEMLRVVYRGWIGPNGCYRLAAVGRHVRSNGVEVGFIGERTTGAGDCTQMPVVLEHADSFAPPLQDPFTITVRQPGGARLEKVVRIE